MTRLRTLVFLTLLSLASGAGAMKLIVWDRELQIPLGYGETSGSRMTVQLVRNYSGPVVLLFSRDDDDKERGLYAGVQRSYPGTLKAGQLTLEVGNSEQTLARFLTGLKLSLTLQPAGQSFTLPGLRTPERTEGGR